MGGSGGVRTSAFLPLVKCAVQGSLTAGTTSGQCLTDRVVRWLWAQLDTTNVMESGCWDTMSQWSQQNLMETGPYIIHIVGHIAALILFILLVKMLKFSKKDFFKRKKLCEGNKKIFWNI